MEALRQQLLRSTSLQEKLAILDALPIVQEQMRTVPYALSPERAFALKQLMAIGQWKARAPVDEAMLQQLLDTLVEIDTFYREMGGIVGYHVTLLQLLHKTSAPDGDVHYYAPSFVDITQEDIRSCEAGLLALPFMAEMIPLGGAADRLHLVEEGTGKELPAAKLCFAGRTLLEGLMRDLQAREYLYFQLFGKQLTTPVAMMTSEEKENHRHVVQICSEHHWFFRPKESFRLFTQPLVPTVDELGNWCWEGPLQLLLKPGGHGAIWKLARDEGVLAWLQAMGRRRALVRQINNPIAGLDYGLLAFTGYGAQHEMVFGFASCPRRIGSAEGVNVVVERDGKRALSNIEYCDFAKFGFADDAHFSSNTNILFVDLKAIAAAVEQCPYPGLLCNFKQGKGRLEMTMQNIADVFAAPKRAPLRAFITYNHRHKTIATAKKAYLPGGSLQETPENCFYELLGGARELLERYCGFRLPKRRALKAMLALGPECLFLYHPALGPLYSIIAQKLRGGSLALHSELQLDIADLEIEELHLHGSLQIRAEQIMGHIQKGILRYSSKTGRCTLRNVSIRNRGVDWNQSRPLWKGQFQRRESLVITLQGHSELIAENVSFVGNRHISVPDGMCLKIDRHGEELIPLNDASPFWHYRLEADIMLERLDANALR